MIEMSFVRAHGRLLAAGMVLTFSSAFGQTYFIALFAGFFRQEFSLSHGDYGGLYMIGTLASAATLIYAGALADRMSARALGAAVLLGLGLVSVVMALVPSWFVLLLAFYLLRLLGQGMASHVSITAMVRWFDAHRGRAISIAALGHPAAQAVLPLAAVASISQFGWRASWGFGAVFLIGVALPLLWWLLRAEPREAVEAASPRSGRAAGMRQWGRREVLGDPLFYAIMAGVLAPAFIGTGVIFHQVHIVAVKGWTIVQFAAGFPVFAAAGVLAALTAGWAIDKWGPRRLLPVYLLPQLAGLLSLAFGTDPVWIFAYMASAGITMGFSAAFVNTLLVELYGQRNQGAIRALAMSGMVFASALSPYVLGVLIDNGIAVETLVLWMALYSGLTVPFYIAIAPAISLREAA
ncbi:Uncharacterized MFS-type transporter [hydrothermal vent metagenome]|uniref:Uncharacterized MFS-type transporter n=1 Tax=hydrothermal vent metagenome TaxID=652676 RepID=A0A3B0SWP0_9ZZZZ